MRQRCKTRGRLARALAAAGALLLASCAGWPERSPNRFSDHAAKLEQYALWSQLLYRERSAAPANGGIFAVRYGGLLGESRTRYLLVTDDEARTHTIVIQGTGTLQNLGIGVEMFPSYDSHAGTNLHSGFRQMSQAVYRDVLPRLKDGYSIGLGGHSAGGAAAQIVAMYLAGVDGKRIDEIYTFGQPKFAELRGGDSKPGLQEKTVRVINCEDAIPLFPTPGRGGSWLTGHYRHSGPVIYLGEDGRVWFSQKDVELFDLDAFAKNMLREVFTGKPFQAHLIETYVERIRGARENPAAASHDDKAHGICRPAVAHL
jgi:hypothetical protein